MPKRRANIYKRKDGRWEARYVSSVGIDGKKKYTSVYASTYREVKEKQAEGMKSASAPTKRNGSLTIEDVMMMWLATTVNSVKETTYQKYERTIRNHIINELGKIQLDSISGQIIDQYAFKKLHEEKLASKTVNDILMILGLGLTYAEEEYGYSKPKIRRVKEEKKEMRVLSTQEQEILERYLLHELDLYKLGVIVTLYSGLRIGEVCALHWDDIRDGRMYISKSVQRVKKGTTTTIVVTSPKTMASKRVIPIPASICQIIEPFRSEGPMLKTSTGKPVEPRLLQMKFQRYIAESNIGKANFHALRHTFATRCIEAGFDIKTLSEILGHTDVKTTLNRYVHSSFELKRNNMDKLRLTIV